MSTPLYTWDLAYLRNVCGSLDPANGGVTVKEKSLLPPTLPAWAEGLAEREITEVPDPKRSSWDKDPPTWEHVTRYTDKGRTWVKSVLAGLDKRFPHGDEDSGEGFFVYLHPGKGLITLYDPGYDMTQEWENVFGKTAPMFTKFRRLPADWRPWTSGSSAPTVFYNGLREDWHLTDSFGAPYFSGAMTQVHIDWAYVLLGLSIRQELLDKILSELGVAAKAWECRVQP